MTAIPVGQVLHEQRIATGLTLDQLAARAGVSRSTLVKIESGATPDPRFSVLARLLAASDTPIETIAYLHAAAADALRPRLVGIGYEGLVADELIDRLRAQHVRVVADVRLTPLSRKPGLAKSALTERLRLAGIEYRHFPALGNPKSNRAGYADRSNSTPREVFRDLLQAPAAQEALGQLRSLAHDQIVAVLCFEADQQLCHRDQVLAAAAQF